MFSTRTSWDLQPNRLSRLLADRRSRGEPVLDLTETNPTRVGLPVPADLLSPLGDPGGRHYAPTPLGLESAREAVARDFARRGVPLGPDRIVLTASTSEAYAFVFKLLCDPGDEILVPRPGYPLFDYLAALDSVRVRGYPLDLDGGWHLDTGALACTERTRGVIVVNPGNPTGAYLKPPERAALEALAATRGLALVSDEVFADYALGPDRRTASSLARDGEALTFTLGGLSKSCALPQVKLAWIAVTGPEPLRRQALARLEVVADTYLSVSTPVQLATPGLLRRLEELQAPVKSRVEGNLLRLRERLGKGSPASLVEPEGGWAAVLRVPATVSEDERVSRLLQDRGVYAHPGYFFDFPREAYLVLSLLTPSETFEDGVDRVLADVML
jgi:alanine-synthesizing transaminase